MGYGVLVVDVPALYRWRWDEFRSARSAVRPHTPRDHSDQLACPSLDAKDMRKSFDIVSNDAALVASHWRPYGLAGLHVHVPTSGATVLMIC